jgi:predicted nucleotidyltransferase
MPQEQNLQEQALKEQILKTLKYFDVQDHPLTLLELGKYLLQAKASDKQPEGQSQEKIAAKIALSEILACLEGDLAGQVSNKYGFYFLTGREQIADNRWHNNLYSVTRLKRAKKFLKRVRHVPFVSAVALTGSEAINNSKQGSDIDLLVLAQTNRIWLARLFLTLYFQVFGVRRHGNKIENRFCLNHYVESGKILDHERHIYTAVEYVSLIPFFGGEEIYDFQQKNLGWIKEYLAQPYFVLQDTPAPSVFKKTFEFVFANALGDFWENVIGKLQAKRIKLGDSIVVEKDELSFHPGNKGRQVLEKVPFEI